jgi:hypothetical protein
MASRWQLRKGHARKSYKHPKPFEEWDALLGEHHEGYVDWAKFTRNQKQLSANAYGKSGDVKSGCGGRAVLACLLACARCRRRLSVAYIRRRSIDVTALTCCRDS